MYKDPSLNFNFFKMLVADNIEGSSKWYGPGKYCDFDFVNDLQ